LKSALFRIVFCVTWLAAIGAGGFVLLRYENAPGSTGQTPSQWPEGAKISPDPTRFTLMMFAHPRCPCTRASVGELNRLLARSQGRIAAKVLFLSPSTEPAGWDRTGLWRDAASIPGVGVFDDVDGQEARRFGAETSGYVVLFDPRGRLLFRGGITSARGHAGDNAGEDAILALAGGTETAMNKTAVFGCSLQNECTVTTNETWKQ
jgi:hypothetical protein